ncbi:O-antigen translocase [Flavobacterium tegetincola]|uniref:O-antigen translocase n=1 Tax=Flavobacterium tegetincola TaxID=150172 RepID=UPI0003FC1107|nr:O-antigen translocase [Flavobacterium tegetincola]
MSVLIKMGTGLITSKMIAIFVGPSGMAYIGNFRNFITTLEGFSTLAFPSGIVKYVGENENNEKQLNQIITTILVTFLVLSSIISCVLYLYSDVLCAKIFGSNLEFQIVFKVVAAVLPFSVVSVLFVSIINGLGKYSKLIYATIISNVLALLLTVLLIYKFELLGALLSIAVSPAVLFAVTFFYVPKELQILKRINLKQYDFSIIKKLSGFSFMILPSILLSPYLTLEIRKFLIERVGLIDAGFWEAMTRVSNLYLIFISTLISLYFYPQLIKATNAIQTKKVFASFYKTIVPLFILCSIAIYIFRFWILKILYSDEFLPVSDLFVWQMVGDLFKICGMILGFQFLAKKIIIPYIVFEVLSIVFLYFLSIYCIETIGVQGVLIAQAIEHFLYFIILLCYFRKMIF